MKKLLLLLLVVTGSAFAQPVAGDPMLFGTHTVTGAFTSGQLEAARGGTGIDTSGSTGVTRVAAGTWTADAGISHLAASSSADLLGVISDETGSGLAVFGTGPTITTFLTQEGDAAEAGYLRLQNAATISWEAAPAGTDLNLSVNASEELVYDNLDCSAGDQYVTTTAAGAFQCGTDDGTNPLAIASPEALTLATGSITLTGAANTITYHSIDIEGGGAGSDDWTAVVCTAGSQHVFFPVDADSTIVVQVTGSADFTMDNGSDRFMGHCAATDTLTELNRSNNGT